MAKKDITPWQRTDRKTLVNNAWLKIHQDTYRLPNGKELDDYYVIEERPGVNVVAITPDNEVILVRQYRAAVKDVVYDFPAGFVEDDGQPLLEQAKRELVEETGYTTDTWFELGKSYAAPHRMHKQDHFFLALDVTRTQEQSLDETEFVNFELIPIEKVKAMIADDEFNCGVCMSSLLKSFLKLQELGREF